MSHMSSSFIADKKIKTKRIKILNKKCKVNMHCIHNSFYFFYFYFFGVLCLWLKRCLYVWHTFEYSCAHFVEGNKDNTSPMWVSQLGDRDLSSVGPWIFNLSTKSNKVCETVHIKCLEYTHTLNRELLHA